MRTDTLVNLPQGGGSMGGRDPRAAEREEARLVASRLPAELQALRAQVHLTRVRARVRVRG